MASDPLIVNLAPTGMVPMRADTPHVPLTTAEILADVERCAEAGVAIVHVHARRPDGTPSQDPDDVAPIVEGIRAIDPELIVCVSCSGRIEPSLEARAAVLDLDGAARPDMASLTLGSNNFLRQASVNAPDVVLGLARRMRERGIRPELEAFEPGMLAWGAHLAERGEIEGPHYANILLGNPGTAPLLPATLAAFLAVAPPDTTWALGGIGRFQLDATMLAIAAGGHVRVGLEDNIWLDRDRTTLATNAALVGRVAQLAALAERPLATPAQARERLGLPLAVPR
ncbi:3-keto-5-aminohexanoate cleavage protein [Conexibacter woesei]|uniref:3-keto-5-aminohexanoate cleavage protein n=1 Tax=Conexibacter woesei TaxID=191495 RepID=UPI00040D52BA|nr:3-keto-5-aminohexanoate cleavage protein [Conexibacter woesei]